MMEYREVELIGGGHEDDDGHVTTHRDEGAAAAAAHPRRQLRLPQDAARGEREVRACV
jgi:hypothetical protein